MTDKPEITVDEALLAELDALDAERTPGPWWLDNQYHSRVGQHVTLLFGTNDNLGFLANVLVGATSVDAEYIVAACNALPALVAEVKRLREDEAQLVALVARAHVEDADDAPLPAPSPDPCRPTKLQAAIEVARKRFAWVVCDTDAGTALLTVLAAAERVPALEARVAEALAALHSLASNRADQDMAGESDSIKQMHVEYLESSAFADAQLRARDAERHHIIPGRCSVYLNLCSNDEWGNKVDAIADEFIAEARARPEADHE